MLIRVQSVTKEEEEEEEKEKKEEEEEEEEDDDVKDVMDVKGMSPSEMVAHVGLYVDCMVVVVTDALNLRLREIIPECNPKMLPFPVLVHAQTGAILHEHFAVH